MIILPRQSKSVIINPIDFVKEMENKNEEIVIESDFPDEFTSSNYTIRLLGSLKKAKANISTVILELVKSATNKRFQDNKDDKHNIDAKYGWERFDVYFKIPVTNENGKVIQKNHYVSTMIVRLDADCKKYLYDFINKKKESVTRMAKPSVKNTILYAYS